MLAWVENNVIRDVSANPSECFVKEIADLYSISVPDNCTAGWALIDGIWVAPMPAQVVAETPPETFLYITYPKSVVVGDLIRLEISVKFAGGSSVPVNGVFRVPIMRESDGKQMEYLKAVFSEGLANVSFMATEPGKLVMDMSKIDPTPTAKIVDSPVIFVDKTTG